jgi:regulator of protease activity HflC (stomatin/prohibitin superfamily)
VLAVLAVVLVAKTATVVPQQSAYVVEYLGKYSRTLQAGFHILIPFFEKIAYRHSLKELALDIAEQICITRDNVQVGVDAVLYMQVLDPHLASYGITNYGFAIAQLAQTTLRSEIGKIELDRTFEARGQINTNVVSELDKASAAWGVKVLRYEIKNITPPKDVLSAMEKQMRAEREKRAVVLTSEGERDAKINSAEGDKQRVIKQSEANKQQQINEAEGQAQAILAVATATAEGLRQVGIALSDRGGIEAMQLRIGEEYVKQFGKLAQTGTTLVVPANLTDLASIVTMATSIARTARDSGCLIDGGPARGRQDRLHRIRRAGGGDDGDAGDRHRRHAAGVSGDRARAARRQSESQSVDHHRVHERVGRGAALLGTLVGSLRPASDVAGRTCPVRRGGAALRADRQLRGAARLALRARPRGRERHGDPFGHS